MLVDVPVPPMAGYAAGWAEAEQRHASPPSSSADEETRQCIRALVACIRAAKGHGPAHEEQLTQMRKVVRLLSLTEEELAGMPTEQRESVLAIRQSTLDKMRRAKQLSPNGTDGHIPGDGVHIVRSGPMAIPMDGLRASPDQSRLLDVAHSAPATFFRPDEMSGSPSSSMSHMMGGMNIGVSPPAGAPMGPPAFYVRKVPQQESARVPGAC